jgi:hypothetical protein
MSDTEIDEEAEGLASLILLGLFFALLIAQSVWDAVTDLPLQVLANSVFVLGTIVSWAGIHYVLKQKSIELNPSRILISELLPAATFSFALVFYTYPAIMEFIFGSPPTYIEKGIFWDVMQVIGAIMITASTVGWVSLVSE